MPDLKSARRVRIALSASCVVQLACLIGLQHPDALAAEASGTAAARGTDQVLTYHADATRQGRYVVPGLNWQHAASLHRDPHFAAHLSGHVYAQPLYWQRRAGGAALLLATENDEVYALDAASGQTLWHRSLGQPVPLSDMPCGDIDPLGITGTPVIDPTTRTVYLDAMRFDPATHRPVHALFALSLEDGSTRAGWPVDVAARLAGAAGDFTARNQNQRGALALLAGQVYVPYGGHFGDCALYHGWVVGVAADRPATLQSWHTQARGGGIWGPGGLVAEAAGRTLLFTTGNTQDARNWGGGEAVIRLSGTLRFSPTANDFFAPGDWRRLDARDEDLGATNPVPFDLSGRALLVALGKDRNAYLLDRDHLGGIGGQLLAQTVARAPIRTSPALYRVGDAEYVAFQGAGAHCPQSRGDEDLTVLRVTGAPTLTTAWCAPLEGSGAPIVTTTDGMDQPIVWTLGADGDERLYGFRADDGQLLFRSAPLAHLSPFMTPIAADGRLYVAADDHVYAFTFQ